MFGTPARRKAMTRLATALLLLASGIIAHGGAIAQQLVAAGKWIEGALVDGDLRTSDGRRYDDYAVDGIRGQVYSIEIHADAFAPLVLVLAPSGQPVLEKAAPTGTMSQRLLFSKDGRYVVRVAAADGGAKGAYRLRIRRLGPDIDETRGADGERIAVLTTLPLASLKKAIRRDCLAGRLTYGEIFDDLKRASADYGEPGLFLTASGFGLATRFERIDDAGQTISNDRWDTAPFYNSVLQVIFHQTRPGRYRSYVFVYGTGMPDSRQSQTLSALVDWVAQGGGRELPSLYRNRRGGPDHYIQVFVYEYERASVNSPARLVRSTPRQAGHLGSAVMQKADAICGGGRD